MYMNCKYCHKGKYRTLNKTRAGFCDRAQKQCRPTPAISEEGELCSFAQ